MAIFFMGLCLLRDRQDDGALLLAAMGELLVELLAIAVIFS